MSKKIRLSGLEEGRETLSGFVKPHEVGFQVNLRFILIFNKVFADLEPRQHLLPQCFTAGSERDANVLQRHIETGSWLGTVPRLS